MLQFNPQYITFDNWYASKNKIKAFRLLGIHCYSRLKSNRKVLFGEGKITIKSLGDSISINSFNRKHGAYIKAVIVELPGVGYVKLLFVCNDKHAEKGKTKYLFSTDYDVSTPQLLLKYRSRWRETKMESE